MISRVKDIFEKYSDNPAIFSENKYFTYGEIHHRVKTLKHLIMNKTNNKPCPIGFCLQKGIKNIIAMLAIITSGCYYIPLDITYPIERINHIINDINPFAIITDNTLSLSNYNGFKIEYPASDSNIIVYEEVIIPFNNIAYVIYTSGSTGKPKGVVISQDSLMNLIDSEIKVLELNSDSRILSYTSIGFDAAGWDIYGAFFSGGILYLASEEEAINPPACHKYIINYDITMITVTPAFLSQMPLSPLPSVKTMVVMGDLSDTKFMDWWSDHTNVFNGYGPTECTIGSTIHFYKKGDNPKNIGFPFDRYFVKIVDGDLVEVPPGTIGEICIGGVGVAIGYHNLDSNTREKFVHLLENGKFIRIYRTGDFGRILSNGEVEFLGRTDNQVKINGIRIELEEIESLTMQLPQIKRCCCVFSDKKIHLFYQSDSGFDFMDIRSHLTKYLHRSVVPSTYTQVDAFKLNHNGKIDKSKLVIPALLSTPNSDQSPSEIIVFDAYAHALNLSRSDLSSLSNFFEIGGTSLDIHKVVSYLDSKRIKITATDLMRNPTINDLVKNITFSDSDAVISNIEHPKSDIFKLTPFQNNLCIHKKIYPSDSSYNTLKVYEFRNTNSRNLQNLWNKIINAHKSFRTRYLSIGSNLMQAFDSAFLISNKNLPSFESIVADIKIDLDTAFELDDTQLVRITLYEHPPTNFIVSVIKDGSISDAYSERIIDSDIQTLLSGQNIRGGNLPKALDKINDQYHNLNPKSREYWNSILKERFYYPISFDTDSVLGNKRIVRKIKLSNSIGIISSKLKTTPYVLSVLSIYHTLSLFTGNKDVVFGTQLADRDEESYRDVVGFMVSTLIFKLNLSSSTLAESIKEIQSNYIDLYSNRFITFHDLKTLWPDPIDFMFVYQNIKEVNNNSRDFNILSLDLDSVFSPFPITWYVHELDDGIIVDVKTSYPESLVNKMIDCFTHYLDQITTRNNVSILKHPDYQHLNGIPNQIPNMSVDQYIKIISNTYPENEAIMYSSETADHLDQIIKYSELETMVSRCAMALIHSHKISKGDVIGLIANRSVNFVVAMLAILRIGGVYVPIDPSYPPDRINYMLSDSDPALIIVCDGLSVDFGKRKAMRLDDLMRTLRYYDTNIGSIQASFPDTESAAYIIYTSGSTGNPKGCVITHKAILNACVYFKDLLEAGENTSVWSHTTISFDIMVLELLLPLFSGGTLMLCPQCVTANPVDHVSWINRHLPTIIQATPTQFSLIGSHIKKYPLLKILVGGEQLNNAIASRLLSKTNNLYNVYGPSETTIWSTCKKIESNIPISIGYPIYNTKCIILDQYLKKVPDGIVGELCIGGIGVSVGYHNKPQITSEKFIIYESERFYRTGDLVRMVDSEIFYVGRTDFQIKIRGQRIELEEITKNADQYPSISRSYIKVFDNESNSKIIVLFVQSSIDIDTDDMFSFLRSKLPPSYIPSFIIRLAKFPETLNGKINSNLLPNPSLNSKIRYSSLRPHLNPRTKTEEDVKEIICEILSLSDLSVTESFLNVGFTSINVHQLIQKLHQKYGLNATADIIYQNSTVERCANFIEKHI